MSNLVKGSDLLVSCLEEEGVEYIFGLPGEENLEFLHSLSKSKKIKLILTRHEQGAGFMAAIYGKLTGKAGVCLSTLGPGATNLITPAAYAQLGGMPVVMITGQKPIKKSKQGKFQVLDVVDMMQPITKYTQQIASADIIPSRVREAFRLALEERPGAVHLELPEDIALETTEKKPITPSLARRPIADEKAIRRAVDMLKSSNSPILVLGSGANRTMTSKMLLEFVNKTNIPFVTTQLGKGVIDESHQSFLGCAALSSGDFVHKAIKAADLIVTVGHDNIEKPPFFMDENGAQVIHVGTKSAEVDAVYFPQIEIIGDIANAVWQIKQSLEPNKNWDFSAMLSARKAEVEHTKNIRDDKRFPIFPPYLVRVVRKAMPSDGIIALDNGVYKIWFARNYNAKIPNTVLLDNALASMGAGLPSAMAASMVFPEKKVMAICGDGGFMMNSQELETAVRLNLNLTVLIINDSGYGMVKWKQENMGFEDFGLSFNNPDFVKYAEAYGAKGYRVENSESLSTIIETCLDSTGVHVIDCPADYSENDKILNKEIKELSSNL
jgi:acetolactate synthase-1/2/3 large subunit